jgi:hypothetical protein
MNEIKQGSRVRQAHNGKSNLGVGVVVAADPDHYHARVNGRAVWTVRWAKCGIGTGWCSEDLVAA